MTYINITKFVRINSLEKDHSMIETRRSKNVVIFIATILRFVLSRKTISSKRLIAIFQYKKIFQKINHFDHCIKIYRTFSFTRVTLVRK